METKKTADVTSYFKNDEMIRVTTKNRFRLPMLLLIALFAFNAAPVAAQSPNTATMIVTVVDQTDAVVKDAKISVVNTATGAVRDAVSGEGGSATIAALSVNGEYKVTVAMTGFTSEDVNGLMLRAGETATVKVKLVATGGKREVTVFGTTEGVRADPQIGRRLDSPQIDETPILGRKVNHGNFLGRGQTVYGDSDTPNTTFGQLVPVGIATNAIPAFANIDPPRMFQLQARFVF